MNSRWQNVVAAAAWCIGWNMEDPGRRPLYALVELAS
jgi:hypothetical protein